MTRLAALAALVLALVLLAGCGGGSDDDTTAASSSTTTEAAEPTSPEVEAFLTAFRKELKSRGNSTEHTDCVIDALRSTLTEEEVVAFNASKETPASMKQKGIDAVNGCGGGVIAPKS